MTAYYNDHDPDACAWLRELIRRGLIPQGEVDDRSILDVRPADLRGFTACHFFAGIGGWAYALRLAGWPDDRPVWTGSPPCQPFSVAGKGLARGDARHLAPHFVSLVRAARPPVLFGEQVASADVFGPAAKGNRPGFEGQPPWAWFDDLSDRLEAAHYAVGASDIPAAGIGAPHIRQRCFFGAVRLADRLGAGLEGHARHGDDRHQPGRDGADAAGSVAKGGRAGGLADTEHTERRAVSQHGEDGRDWAHGGREEAHSLSGTRSEVCGLANPGDGSGVGCEPWAVERGLPAAVGEDAAFRPRTDHGGWALADWLSCRDGKWRPVEPGSFPLAHGIPARVGRLRGYGNSIVPQAAAKFIRAFLDATEAMRPAA